jgi:MoaA/NifB/PqqE/SkfB family radical SAM enzyme
MGEPLIHPQLPRFIQLAGNRGYKSIITTNGTLLHRRREELLSAGLHKVNLSMHSFESGSDEAFADYLENLAVFAHAAAEAGVIVVFRLWNKGYDNGRNEFALSVLRDKLSGEWVENTRGLRIREKLFVEAGDRFAWPDSNAPLQGEEVRCYGLKDQFGVLADGTVVPCCLDSDGVIALGNVFCQELTDILESERAKAIVQGFSNRKAVEDLCCRCGYARKF